MASSPSAESYRPRGYDDEEVIGGSSVETPAADAAVPVEGLEDDLWQQLDSALNHVAWWKEEFKRLEAKLKTEASTWYHVRVSSPLMKHEESDKMS